MSTFKRKLMSRSKPHLVHVMPKVELSGPLMFVRDLAVRAREFDHTIIGFNAAKDADEELDKFLSAYGVDVYYLNSVKLNNGHIRRVGGTHVVFYDLSMRHLDGKRHPGVNYPSMYYAYSTRDPEVRTAVTVYSREDVHELEPDFVIAPGVAKGECQKYHQSRRALLKERLGVTLLAGRKDKFHTKLAVRLMSALDSKHWVLMLTEFPGQDPFGLLAAKEAAIEKKLLAPCKFRPGVATFYLSYATVHLSTGCQRIDAEAGMFKVPIVDGLQPIDGVLEDIDKIVTDPDFRTKARKRSQLAADSCDLRMTITHYKNIIRACV